MNLSLKELFALARAKDCPAFAIDTPDEFATADDIVQMYGVVDPANGTRDYSQAPPIVGYDIASGARALTSAAEGFVNEMNDRITPPGMAAEVLTYLRDNLPGDNRSTGQKGGIVIFFGYHHCLESPDKAFIIQATRNLFPAFKGTRRTFIGMGPLLTLPVDLQGEMLRHVVGYPTRTECEKIIRDLVKITNEDAAAKQGLKYIPPTEDIITRASRVCVGLKSPAVVEQVVSLSIGNQFGGLSVERINDQRVLEINSQPWFKVMSNGPTFEKDYCGYEAAVQRVKRLLDSDRAGVTLVVRLEEAADAFRGSQGGGASDGGVKADLHQEALGYLENKKRRGIWAFGEPGSGKSWLSECAANYLGVVGIAFDVNACLGSLMGDSGRNFRMALRTLEALAGDGTTLVIATSNDLSVSPQMKSRFSAIYYFPTPEEENARRMWGMYRKQFLIPDDDPTPAVRNWTGREIRNCCRDAYDLRIPLAEAALSIVPVSVEGKAEMEARMKQAHERLLSAVTPGIYRMPSTVQVPAGNGTRRALEVD